MCYESCSAQMSLMFVHLYLSFYFCEGEEIISGAQRVHVPEFLATQAKKCGINVETISTYIDSFR